jgi:hypothetical protein
MKEMPTYPVYVISKGRADCCFTANFLIEDGVDFHIVVEPQEEELYAAIYGSKRLYVLPFSNLGLGGIPARNWVWEHAKAAGHKRHWILDDNIRNIRKYHKGKKLKVSSGLAFKVVEDFTDRYTNVALSGFNYSTFVGLGTSSSGQKYPPFHLNVHIYSALLILNDLEQRWRGRYNEDTDLCLQVLSDNWCTVSFNIFNADKMATMTMKGGNTTELYKGDGRLEMARALERAWPGVVETKSRYGRPQHHVTNAWKKFDTQLIRRTDIDWDALQENPYKMELKQVGEISSERVKAILGNKAPISGEVAEFPIYIPSRKRATSITTAKLFKADGVPFKVVVEPQDEAEYLRYFTSNEVLVMDKNDQGIAYVRNFIKQHSTNNGNAFHWQFDDNIKNFALRTDDKNVKCSAITAIKQIEQVVAGYSNIGGAGMMHQAFAFAQKKDIVVNRQVYTAMLLSNATKAKFRDGIIEDTDYNMQILTEGYCTLLFARVIMNKETTMKMTGGNTEISYAGNGRLLRSQALADAWPMAFKIVHKDGRTRIAPSKIWASFQQVPIEKEAL